MAGDLPGKEDVFDSWSRTDVVLDEIAARIGRFLVHDDAEVRNVAAEIPSDKFAGKIVVRAVRNRQRFSFSREEDAQIGNAAMIDVCVCVGKHPTALIRVSGKILFHVLVNFLLQINSQSAIGADDFVGADSGIGGDIAVGVGDAAISGIVADGELSAFSGGLREFSKKSLARVSGALGPRAGRVQE